MKQFNYEIGKVGEKLAAEYLQKKGYQILKRNFQTRFGEIDLVAAKDKRLIFVEVKLKIGEDFGTPEEMINPAKMAKLEKMANFFVLENPELARKYPLFEMDAVCLVLDETGKIKRLTHYKNINI